jgi:hypothetical protein
MSCATRLSQSQEDACAKILNLGNCELNKLLFIKYSASGFLLAATESRII